MQAFRRFRLDWRRKAVAFRLFSALPGGSRLHYLTQRYVTRTFPRNLADHDRWQIVHAQTFARLYGGELASARLFEFGAGWDLHSSLVLWCYGVNHQTVVDISPLARPEQINHAIRYLSRNPPPGALRAPEITVGTDFVARMATLYGIHYRAPLDARDTQLPDDSIDLVCTTSVLEHIPRAVLASILRECRRICAPGAVLSHVVDYTDHYAHSDAAITAYNFLRFSEAEWERFNPPIHYQNRLRHFEYRDLFEAAGFHVLSDTTQQAEEDLAQLARVPLAGRFAAMTSEQLLPRNGHWVLVSAARDSRAL